MRGRRKWEEAFGRSKESKTGRTEGDNAREETKGVQEERMGRGRRNNGVETKTM